VFDSEYTLLRQMNTNTKQSPGEPGFFYVSDMKNLWDILDRN